MLKVVFASIVGLIVGILCVVWVVPASIWLQKLTGERVFAVDHWVYYLIVVLGGSSGAVCGALAAGTSVLAQALRDRTSSRP
jgi:hypothetical protein